MKKITIGLCLALTLSFSSTYEDGLAAYKKKDYATTIKIWEDLASKNDIKAQNELGKMYYYGFVIAPDYQKAYELFEQSANSGDAVGQNFLVDKCILKVNL